jgi:hypothetical protein
MVILALVSTEALRPGEPKVLKYLTGPASLEWEAIAIY